MSTLASPATPRILSCIGDSITFGYGVQPAQRWSSLLQARLGSSVQLHNFGLNGRCVLQKADMCYAQEPEFAAACALDNDLVLLALGTNDSKAHNWCHREDFARDYSVLIKRLRGQGRKRAEIFCLLAPPSLSRAPEIDHAIILHHINPLIRQLAAEHDCQVIDTFSALERHLHTLEDSVHPNAEGHRLLAECIHAALLQQAGGLLPGAEQPR